MATVPQKKAPRKTDYPTEPPNAVPYCAVPWREMGWDAPYPTTDGKPMGESPLHGAVLRETAQVLKPYMIARDPSNFVEFNMVVCYRKGDITKFVCPDVLVALGAGNHYRDAYLLWQEKTPDLVIEVTSKSTRRRDEHEKLWIYQDELNVPEYFLFDPNARLKPPLQGYRWVEGRYQPIVPVDGRLPSEVLGLHLERHGRELRLYDATVGRWLPTFAEEIEARDAALAEKAAALRTAEAELQRLRQENEALRRRPGRPK